MGDSIELEQSINSFIDKFQNVFEANKKLFEEKLVPNTTKIEKFLIGRNYPKEQISTYFKKCEETINNYKVIESFNNQLKSSFSQDKLSLQYLNLINSEFQQMVSYFETENYITSLTNNLSKLDSVSVDYQTVNLLHNYLINILDKNSKIGTTYLSKISQLQNFELIKSTNQNIVIIGANGSGKSSFSRSIKSILGENIVIISAQKVFQSHKINSIPVTNTKLNNVWGYQQQDKLCKEENFVRNLEEDMQHLIEALISEFVNKSTIYYSNRNNGTNQSNQESILEKLFTLWHEIIPNRELFYDNNGSIKVKGNEISEYDFFLLSDGEKAAFYYTANILLAKENSYIIIDEPENHLNLSVVTKMWNILEQQRTDCTFMYLTHNLHFASSRLNAKKLWMKSYNQAKKKWNVEILPTNEDLPEELYMELLGSKSKILFCEGDGNSSYDYKLYSILFPEYTVKPVKGHYDVISSVRAFNKSSSIHNNEAIGIIDRDFHTDDEISAWEKDKIYSLPVCEIENLFLDEKIISEAIFRFCSKGTCQDIKEHLFSCLKKDIDRQALLFVCDVIKSSLSGFLLKEKKDINTVKEEIKRIPDSINVEKLYKQHQEELKEIVEKKRYNDLIKKNNSKELCHKLDRLIESNYCEKIITHLQQTLELQQYIKEKYFDSEIFKGEIYV